VTYVFHIFDVFMLRYVSFNHRVNDVAMMTVLNSPGNNLDSICSFTKSFSQSLSLLRDYGQHGC